MVPIKEPGFQLGRSTDKVSQFRQGWGPAACLPSNTWMLEPSWHCIGHCRMNQQNKRTDDADAARLPSPFGNSAVVRLSHLKATKIILEGKVCTHYLEGRDWGERSLREVEWRRCRRVRYVQHPSGCYAEIATQQVKIYLKWALPLRVHYWSLIGSHKVEGLKYKGVGPLPK